jgi:RNA-dependent RNA polymerase
MQVNVGVLTRHRVFLHGSSFSDISSVPINFHVHLHTDKERLRKHSGTGILTLPTIQCGDRFLGLSGYDSSLSTPNLRGKIVMFKPSNHTGGPRSDVLETITHLPCMD